MADEAQTQTRVYETTSMGFKLNFRGPATVEDYNKKADSTTGCLDDACDNTIYRSTLPEFQDAFAKKVLELTGIERQVNTGATEAAKSRSKTPEKVKDVLETVPKYVRRAIAGMSDEDKKALQTVAQEVADGIEVDPSPSKRQAKIPADLLAKADSVLDLEEDDREAKITKWQGMLSEAGDSFELERGDDNVPTRTSLARMVQAVVKTSL